MAKSTRLSTIALVVVAGCAVKQVAHITSSGCPGICSEGSGYAPVARLFVSMERMGDVLTVVVDSGTVGVPSLQGDTPGPALMARLALRAFVAVSTAELATDITALDSVMRRGHAWRARAESGKQPIADTLHYAEVRSIPSRRFQVTLPARDVSPAAWLGFEITGDAIDPRADSPARRTMVDGVRVYACDPRNLGGAVDSGRARLLAIHYTEAC